MQGPAKPLLRGLVEASATYRYWVLGTAALFVGKAPADYSIFAPAGESLWRGDLEQVYESPTVQAGPLQLGLAGAAHGLARVAPNLDIRVIQVVGSLLMLVALLRTIALLRSHLGYPPSPHLELVVGALALIWGWVGHGSALGHPALIVIPVSWVLVGLLLRTSHAVLAGVVLALSTGWETWGALGAPLLLLAVQRRHVASAVMAGVVTCSVLWLPFLLVGPFEMTSLQWQIDPATPVAWILDGSSFTTGMRAVQLVAAVLGGACVALLTRRSANAVWLVPLAATCMRLWLDPLQFSYYWLVPASLTLIGLGTLSIDRRIWASLVIAMTYLQFVALAGDGKVLVLLTTTLLVAAAVVSARNELADGDNDERSAPPNVSPPMSVPLRSAGR